MTILIKECKGNGSLVSMTVDKDGVYTISVYTEQDSDIYGYPEREMSYSQSEKKNYVKKYCKGEI